MPLRFSTAVFTASSRHTLNRTKRALLLLPLLLALTNSPTYAQTIGWTSAELVGDAAGANGSSSGARVRPDGQGGSWALGAFTGRIAMGTTMLESRAGSTDFYIGRLDAAGQWLWAVRGGGPLIDRAGDVALDATGNAYLTGSFQDSIRFGATQLVAQGGSRTNLFVAKISPTGQWLWAVQGQGETLGIALAINPQTGEPVVAGTFAGVASLGSYTLLPTTNQLADRDVFVARLGAATGQWLGAVSAGGNRAERLTSLIVTPQGRAVVAGTTTSASATFGAVVVPNRSVRSNLSLPTVVTLFADAFVAMVNLPTMQWAWATTAGGAYDETAEGLATGPNGTLFVAGTFNGGQYDTATRVQFDTYALRPARDGARPVYVAQLGPSGQWLAATAGADSSQATVGGITVDATGAATVAGAYATRYASFGAVRLTNSLYAGSAPYTYQPADLFVARLSAARQWAWATSVRGAADEFSADIVTEPLTGTLLLTGRFTGQPQFGTTPALTSLGAGAAYVARLTATGGAPQWALAVAPGAGGSAQVFDMALDRQGNTVVVGTYSGRTQLGTLALVPPPGSRTANLLYVAKRSPAGQWLWATTGQLVDPYGRGPRVVVDPVTDDIYLTGAMQGASSLGTIALPVPPPARLRYGQPPVVLFMARLSGAGQWQWATTPGFNAYSQPLALALDPRGGVVMVGMFSDTLTLGTSTIVSTGASPGYDNASDGFLARVSPFGQWQSVVRVSGPSYDYLTDVTVDSSGAAIVAGEFLQGVTLDSAAGLFFSSPTTYFAFNSYIARLSAANTWEWAVAAEFYRRGAYFGVSRLRLDRAGNVLVAGTFADSVRLGTHYLHATGINRDGGDAFVAKINGATRQWQWAQRLGGNTYENNNSSLALDAAGNIYVGGTFTGTIRLGSSVLTGPSAYPTGFVAKMSAAGAWQWGVQGRTTDRSAVTALVVRAADELVVAGSFSSPLTLGATTLPSGYLPMGFLATTGRVVGLEPETETETGAALTLYPNPARATVIVRINGTPTGPQTGVLFDALGRECRRFTLAAGQPETTLDLRACAPGLYVVRVGRHSQRLVVE